GIGSILAPVAIHALERHGGRGDRHAPDRSGPSPALRRIPTVRRGVQPVETMRLMHRRPMLLIALILVVAALTAPAWGGAEQGSVAAHRVHVDLSEWAVVPSHGVVSAGPLRLTVENFGRLRH